MKILVVEAGKKPYVKEIKHTLEEMQKIVGGLIEPIYFDDAAIIVNEEGKFNGSTPNRALYDDNGKLADIIFGTFFVCNLGEEDFISLSEENIKKFTALFAQPEMIGKIDNEIIVLRY